MINFVRAGGIAAASVALIATATFASPSQAEQSANAAPAVHYLTHASASLDAAQVADSPATAAQPAAPQGAPVAQPAAPAAAPAQNPFARIGQVFKSTFGGAQAQPAVATVQAQPRSLHELVAAHAGTEVGDAEQECLANAVYFEARGEPVEGQLAVAEVVLNRTRSGKYPTGICDVVVQPWQFSFIRKGRFPQADRSSDSWRKAVAISRIALDKLSAQVPQDVLWYHATYVSQSWGKRLKRETQIGLHIFYS